MFKKFFCTCLAFGFTILLYSQNKEQAKIFPDSITPVGIIKGMSDSELLDVVQRQTFRYFWHFAYPVSGLARERDNTVRADYYWFRLWSACYHCGSSKGMDRKGYCIKAISEDG